MTRTTSAAAARRPATDRQIWVTVGALTVTAVLIGVLTASWRADHHDVVSIGDRLPLASALHNGQAHEVLVPGTSITVQVGEPVREIDPGHLDPAADHSSADPVRAADDARLVPVTWSARPADTAAGQDATHEHIGIVLVAGEDRVELARATGTQLASSDSGSPPSSIIAVGADVTDLSVEVSFDGATQRIDVTAGEVDRGAAEQISRRAPSTPTGCEEPAVCTMTAQGTAPWRPAPKDALFTVGPLVTYAWDADLGWAGEGRRWAAATVHSSTTSTTTDGGDGRRSVDRAGAITAALDGRPPERSEGLGASTSHETRYGRVVFDIAADHTLEQLTLRRDLVLEGEEHPRTVTTGATLRLGER